MVTPISHLCLEKHSFAIVRGWCASLRSSKKIAFIDLRDGLDVLQLVVPKELVSGVDREAFIEVEGQLEPLPAGTFHERPFELHVSKLTVLAKSSGDFSTRCPPGCGPDVKIRERHLYLRDPEFSRITDLRATLVQAIRDYFDDSMREIHPPSFVGTQCEGGSTLFKLDYPAKDHGEMTAYLTQSSQFYLEYCLPALGDVYCIAPSFRAERSQGRRHVTEFLHAECEWTGVFTMEEHVAKLKDMMKGILERFLSVSEDLLKEMGLLERVQRLSRMCDESITMTHREAIQYCREHEIYKDEETREHFGDRDDIPEAAERKMIDQIDKIVYLTHFPKEFKSFYFRRGPDDTVLGCDVCVPGVGEIVGSGVRMSDYDELHASLLEAGLKPEEYREYLDLRKYGSGCTSGMGLGVDRMLTWLLDRFSIREVITFPRYPGQVFP